MKGYINTSNYYLSTITSSIPSTGVSWSFTVSEITVDWATLPEKWYYWVDVDFWDASKREIFKIKNRVWYTLFYDNRISPYGLKTHDVWASVWLRDFSQLLNSLSANTDNFWEVERLGGFNIKVYWGNVNISWTSYVQVPDAEFTLTENQTFYIEYDTVANTFVLSTIQTDDNYPVAKIITADAGIQAFEDLRAVLIAAKDWDMKKTVYDPDWIEKDAFDMDNMKQWEYNMYVSWADKASWNNKQDRLDSWNNIKTINWYDITGSWDLVIWATLWVDWVYETSWLGVSSYQLSNEPATSKSFMVFVNSGTWIFPTTDYSYNDTTRTITLNTQLENDERLMIWLMKKWDYTVDPLDIWRWTISIIKDWVTHTFNVNQTNNSTIDLGSVWNWTVTVIQWDTTLWTFWLNDAWNTTIDLSDSVKDGSLTIRSWWNVLTTFTANQATNADINFEKSILVTADEYAALPESKLTDWNFYFIYS